MKRPAFQFYPADWRKDPALRACSIEARGLWIDMICIMHESENYGFLEINSRKILEKSLATMCGITPSKCRKFLSELEENGVFSRDDRGVIFSRRMVKDNDLRGKRQEAGKLGGNPALVKQLVNQTGGDLLNQASKQKPTPSSSSSSSASAIPPTPCGGGGGAGVEWWKDNHPTGTAELMANLQSRINRLHPAWTKRPHFSAKELHALSDNSSAWLAVEDDDWALLAAYMDADIPAEWRKDPRDFPQPDNRLGLINIGSTSILGYADNWSRKCKREGIRIELKPNLASA